MGTGCVVKHAAMSVRFMFRSLVLAMLVMPFCFADAKPAAPAAKDGAANAEAGERLWYFFTGNSNNHPRLHKAQQQIDEQINQPFRLIAPCFDDVKTFADQAQDFMIWTPYIGVGRKLSTHFDLFAQAGYSAGSVRTKANDTSLLLLPFHTDVQEKRSSFFAGLGLAWFPWGFVELQKYDSIGSRLANTRPYLVNTYSWNRLTFEGNVKSGLWPLPSLIHVNQKEHWSLFSTGIGAGADIPLSASSALSMNLQYTFFLSEGEDFSGPGFNMHWKKFF